MLKFLIQIPFLVLAASYLGFLHPIFNSIIEFRQYLLVIVLISAIFLITKKKYMLGILHFLLAVYTLLPILNINII